MKCFNSILEIEQHNKAIGHHWFDADSLRFFSSRINDELFGSLGDVFISSEKHSSDYARFYTVRQITPRGSITSVAGGFQAYSSMSSAKSAARRYVKTPRYLLGDHDEPDGTGRPDSHLAPWEERQEADPPERDLIDIFNEAVQAIPYPDIEPTLITMGDLDDDSQEIDYSEEYIFPIGTLANETLWAGGWVDMRRDTPADDLTIAAHFGVARNKEWNDKSILGEDEGLMGWYDLDTKTWTLEIDIF